MIIHPHFHGVYKDNELSLKWASEVRYKNLYKRCGLYDTDKLAAKGYDAMVIKLHLDNVLDLNFPPEPELALFKTIFKLVKSILCLNAGLGTLALANRRARAARGNIRLPMINPNLLISKAIYKLIQLLSVKGQGFVVRNQAHHDCFNRLMDLQRKHIKVGGLLGQLRIISICPGFY